jgi:hypothetical protein
MNEARTSAANDFLAEALPLAILGVLDEQTDQRLIDYAACR